VIELVRFQTSLMGLEVEVEAQVRRVPASQDHPAECHVELEAVTWKGAGMPVEYEGYIMREGESIISVRQHLINLAVEQR
jgi:hypothetical protein